MSIALFVAIFVLGSAGIFATEYRSATADEPERFIPLPSFDRADYGARLLALAHMSTSTLLAETFATSTGTSSSSLLVREEHSLWPVHTVYPDVGAILPFKRIVAYYGNFYSKGMGVLGQYPPAEMLQKLNTEVLNWVTADPTTPVIPAIDYIAVTAQGSAGDGKYRARMPDDQIDQAVALADQVHGIVFLDVQVGLSDLQTEIPLLEKYLKMPEVHLAIDPEFSMKTGDRPAP